MPREHHLWRRGHPCRRLLLQCWIYRKARGALHTASAPARSCRARGRNNKEFPTVAAQDKHFACFEPYSKSQSVRVCACICLYVFISNSTSQCPSLVSSNTNRLSSTPTMMPHSMSCSDGNARGIARSRAASTRCSPIRIRVLQ